MKITKYFKLKIKNYERGGAMIIVVILFLALSLIAVFGIINPMMRHVTATRSILESKQGFYLAEAGIEDIIYRLKNGMQTLPSNTLSLAGEDVVTSITDTAGGKTLTSSGDNKGFIRKTAVDLVTGIGISFNYGVQTGTGGFVLSNNSGVNGNVYAGGPIIGSDNSFITGSAFSANSASSTINQENSSPIVPPSQIVFGNANGTQDVAQSFQVSTTGPIGKVAVYIKKVSTPSNITVRIVTDNAGSPGSTSLVSATLSAALITTNFGWVEIPLGPNFDLVPGTDYWIVLDAGTDSSKYYILGANSVYLGGTGKTGRFGTSWSNTSPSGLDGYFKVYIGGLTGSISEVNIGSTTSGIGDAKAHTINNSTIVGGLYCQTGSGNNKSCDTSQTDPTPLPFPISDANIDAWKNEAEAGNTINGNVILSGSSSNMGPTKIIGNLTINNGHILTLNGTLWVTGTISISNNVVVKLTSGYGASSGAIVSDGRISLSNNVNFQGSGPIGSYILLLTTSNCPNGVSCGGNPAMNVGNNAGTVILNAQQGTISFSNNSGAKEATANLISLSNNATITYDTGLANVNFSSGPSGGFDVLSWKEIE